MDESLWLQLETRVRKLVRDLIEPTIQRGEKQKRLQKAIEKTSDELKNRLDLYEVQVAKLLTKTDMIDGYSRTLMEFEAGLRLVESRYQFDIEFTRLELEGFSKKIASALETVAVLDNQRISMEKDIERLYSTINTNKHDLNEKISRVDDILKNHISDSESLNKEIHIKVKQLNENLMDFSNDLGETSTVAKKVDKMYEDLKFQFKHFNRVLKTSTTESKDHIEKVRQMASQFSAKAHDDNKSLKEYIEKEYQMNNFLQISDILHQSFTDLKNKHSFAEYETAKYLEWEELGVPKHLQIRVGKNKRRAKEVLDTPIPPPPPPEPRNRRETPKSNLSSSYSSRRPVHSRFSSKRQDGEIGDPKDSSVEKDHTKALNTQESVQGESQTKVAHEQISRDSHFSRGSINKSITGAIQEIAKDSQKDVSDINNEEISQDVQSSKFLTQVDIQQEADSRPQEIFIDSPCSRDSYDIAQGSRMYGMDTMEDEEDRREFYNDSALNSLISLCNDLKFQFEDFQGQLGNLQDQVNNVREDLQSNLEEFQNIRQEIQKQKDENQTSTNEFNGKIEEILGVHRDIYEQLENLQQAEDELSNKQSQAYLAQMQLKSTCEELKTSIESISKNENHEREKFMKIVDQHIEDINDNTNDIQKTQEKYIEESTKKWNTLELLIEQAVNECNSAVAQRKRDHSDNASEFKKVFQKAEALTKKNEIINQSIENLRKVIDLLVEFAKINIALVGQDEIDKESMSLMGIRDSPVKTSHRSSSVTKRMPVELDKVCLSCSGHANLIANAFKMACISYSPSLVPFRGCQYDRNELVDLQRKILDGVWDQINTDSGIFEINLLSPKPTDWKSAGPSPMLTQTSRFTPMSETLPPLSLSRRTNN
ncbi:unnamed protein product [Blepharisma stoltei]|uniref:Uncharacterized protein n=1 Tax=Blepharisma stoltei TaxID=1481888 RepID=A0AAU9JA03_9CILI|nr:unnamed protein product [Blepharisma stoltei]